MMQHINKVINLAKRYNSIEAPMNQTDVLMTLLKSLSPSYATLITSFEVQDADNLTKVSLEAKLLHEESRRREHGFSFASTDTAILSKTKHFIVIKGKEG